MIDIDKKPLKISELIDKLNSIKEKHGDIKVGTWNDGIVKFIRSAKYIEAENDKGEITNSCVALQWWYED